MDVGQAEIHVVAFDGVRHTTDEDDRAIRLQPLDDPDVGQWVVHFAIPIEVPGVVEEDEIAWVDDRPLVERALLPDMGMDNSDAVGVRVARFAGIEIDPVREKHGASHSSTVIGDASPVARNRFRAHEIGRCLHYGVPTRPALTGLTAAACL